MKGKDILKTNVSSEYHYLIDMCHNKENQLINKIILECLNYFDTEILHFFCSWFIGLEYDTVEKLGYDCHYYDVDKFVCNVNRKLSNKVNCVDVVFDQIDINDGIIINKYCENTYPIGKLYNNNMILIGSDNPHLSNINPITSCEQLIEQNELDKIVFKNIYNSRYNYYVVCS